LSGPETVHTADNSACSIADCESVGLVVVC
jgi:hypothetical protein